MAQAGSIQIRTAAWLKLFAWLLMAAGVKRAPGLMHHAVRHGTYIRFRPSGSWRRLSAPWRFDRRR